MTRFLRRWHLYVLGVLVVLAGLARFWAAPLSAGPDVAQFWAFAQAFRLYGLDFYQYADATADFFPFKMWGFVYPPVWLLFLRLALLAVPHSLATASFVDTGWRLAMKTPVMLADLAIGLLIYLAVPGPKTRRLAYACMWLFHPTAWYESAVFGQFDAIAVAFLLGSVIFFERQKDRLGFLFGGLAVLTKQYTLLPVVVMAAISLRRADRTVLVRRVAYLVVPAALMSLPFLSPDNAFAFLRSVLLPVQGVDYQRPLVYSFSGIGALMTYLHDRFGMDTLSYLSATVPHLAAASIAIIYLSYRRRLSYMHGAFIGVLAFTGMLFRVHYQYLILYLPLAIIVAARAARPGEKAVALSLAVLPALWTYLWDVSFWFVYFEPKSTGVAEMAGRIGFTSQMPDYLFVTIALAIAGLCLAYIPLAFLRWHGTRTARDDRPDARDDGDTGLSGP